MSEPTDALTAALAEYEATKTVYIAAPTPENYAAHRAAQQAVKAARAATREGDQ